MGGYGSGVRATKKTLLEDSWALPAHATIKGLEVSKSPAMFQISYALPDAYGTRSAQLYAEATLLHRAGRACCARSVVGHGWDPTCVLRSWLFQVTASGRRLGARARSV